MVVNISTHLYFCIYIYREREIYKAIDYRYVHIIYIAFICAGWKYPGRK